MALRMNLYGCEIAAIHETLGSRSNDLLAAACAGLEQTIDNERTRNSAIAWLRTLVQTGHPLRTSRPEPLIPSDGSLLVSHLETESHVFALHCLLQGMRQDDWLDLTGDSSHWQHATTTALYNELASCGFTQSGECPKELFRWMEALQAGTPLFGDDFCTKWSYYSLLPNTDLGDFVRALDVALRFEKPVPDLVPEHIRATMNLRLSDDGRALATELMGWLRHIADADQDAYILWW